MRKGSQLQSRESYTFGRFECLVKPGYGSGIMAGSFYTFNDKPGFQTNWEEIDWAEWLGMNTNRVELNVIKTIGNKKTRHSESIILPKRSSDEYWKLTGEWTPGLIVWKINDKTVRALDISLNIPQKICMNIWRPSSKTWAGELNEGILPQYAKYEYVQYSAFDINTGKFNFKWKDSFNTLDLNRWKVADWPLEDNTILVKENVYIEDNKLVLKLT